MADVLMNVTTVVVLHVGWSVVKCEPLIASTDSSHSASAAEDGASSAAKTPAPVRYAYVISKKEAK